MMKNIISKLILLSFVALIISCSTEDRLVDEIFDNTTRGTVLRTLESSIELPEGTDDDFYLLLELQGAELSEVEKLEVYVSFTDNTPDNGTTTIDETLYKTIAPSEFTTDERLPRAEIQFNLNDLEDFFSIDQADYKGGDRFVVTLELHMKNGIVFTDTNAASQLSGPFYKSPFRYNANIICPVGEDKFVGEYTLESITPGAFGVTAWLPGEVVTIEKGAGQTNRVMAPTYGENLGFSLTPDFKFDLLCGEVVVPEDQGTGLGCSAIGLMYGPAASGESATYPYAVGEPIDDETLTIIFSDNYGGDCGESTNTVTAVFTKN